MDNYNSVNFIAAKVKNLFVKQTPQYGLIFREYWYVNKGILIIIELILRGKTQLGIYFTLFSKNNLFIFGFHLNLNIFISIMAY